MKKFTTPFLFVGIALGLAVAVAPVAAKMKENDAPAPPERSADTEIMDPLEPLNRIIFGLNDVIDLIAIKPIVDIWKGLLPQPVQTAVSNVFSNLDDVFGGTSHALQGHGQLAANNFGRVIVNSTIGVAGVFDVASGMGLQKTRGDFGQALGVWGVPAGPYIVLPLIGPSTARETIGRVGRYYTDPRTYIEPEWRNSLMALEYAQIRADGQSNDTLLNMSSLDKYVFVRNLYLQRRSAMVREGLEAGGANP